MNYKLLCSDLDGTLLSTKSDVSDYTIHQIKRIRDYIRVILVSARMPSGMYYLQERLGINNQPIICYNGALILNDGKEIFSTTISSDILLEVYKLSTPLNIYLGIYELDNWFVPKSSHRVEKEINNTKTQPQIQDTLVSLSTIKNRGAHKVMLMGTKESADQLMPLLQNNLGNKLHLYRSNDTLIELAPKSVSKLSAIKLIMRPNDSLEDIIAFGDNYNDIEMLEAVGSGVAVANAREEVKKIANYITLSNTDNGVADFIQKNIHI